MSSADSSVIPLTRNIDVIQIPSGAKGHLEEGTPVMITQALGGTFTVLVQGQSGLYRIAGKDADALGKEVPADAGEATVPAESGKVTDEMVWEQLKTCFDPEIPVNIVDLGLIYKMELMPREEGGYAVQVDMTLTAPGCGMGPAIAADAQSKIMVIPGVEDARVDVVWDPPWSPDRISDEGRAKLGME